MPPAVPIEIGGAPELGSHTAFLAESWSGGVERASRGVRLLGNSRAVLVRSGTSKAHLNLLGKTLRFTVDVSRVPCGVNAAFYFVSSRELEWHNAVGEYCDINSIYMRGGSQPATSPGASKPAPMAAAC